MGSHVRPRHFLEQNVLDMLVFRGLISRIDLDAALVTAQENSDELETLLLDRYRIPKAALGGALSEFYQCPYLPYDERTAIDGDLFRALSIDYLRKNLWLPITRRASMLDVLTTDPNDADKGWDIRRAFPGVTIRYSVGLKRDVEQFLVSVKRQGNALQIGTVLNELIQDIPVQQNHEPEAPLDEDHSSIVRLANHVIVEADRQGASDIHIEPYADRKDMAVRFRVDGSCFTFMRISPVYRRAVISRLKVMANLDIAERRKPQDGKMRFRLPGGRDIELRVATLPTAGGDEDMVLRLLTAKEPMPLEAMDFRASILENLKTLARRPHGLILCVGPTGSGKTTTLHAILRYINTDEKKIWTAEDPIEITQDGLRQVQIHQKIGLTFATAMRAFLRADPDVIMIGEMRDKETADIAIEASLTGHLVLSTLHTNSAIETVVRLLDLGCNPFHFADAMLGVLAQRLCKRICQTCREEYHPDLSEYEEIVEEYGAEDWTQLGATYHDDWRLFRGRGCHACNGTGYRARLPVHEFLPASDAVKRLVQRRAQTSELLAQAKQEGFLSLMQDGIQKTLRGLTAFSQVRAVAMK